MTKPAASRKKKRTSSPSRKSASRPPTRAWDFDLDYFRHVSDPAAMQMLKILCRERPSRTERMELGKRARKKVPRTSHAAYRPARNRPDPVAMLEKQNAARIQNLVPLRNARMLASPFAFLRGAAAIMARDLASAPVTGMTVACCGDMHVSNFGLFASAERNLLFGINDFDEVHAAPWEWDLKRLAASAAVAVRFLGGNRSDARTAAAMAVRGYRKRMQRYAEMGFLEVWYDRIDERKILDTVSPRLRRSAEDIIADARARGPVRVLDKMTERVGDQHRLIEQAPLVVRQTHRADGKPISIALDEMLRSYFSSLPDDRKRLLSRYRIVDVARKAVGVGSIGTSCWVIFLEGLDLQDPLFLQVKEARQSVLAPYVETAPMFANQGQRVVAGQRLIQGSPDVFLGWGEDGGHQYYVRQLSDMKGGMRLEEGDTGHLEIFPGYCGLCGWALALAHAKSGEAAMIAGYCGRSDALDQSLADFALSYLEQTEMDFELMVRAAKTGRLKVPEDCQFGSNGAGKKR